MELHWAAATSPRGCGCGWLVRSRLTGPLKLMCLRLKFTLEVMHPRLRVLRTGSRAEGRYSNFKRDQTIGRYLIGAVGYLRTQASSDC